MPRYLKVTDRQTDGRTTTIAIPRFAVRASRGKERRKTEESNRIKWVGEKCGRKLKRLCPSAHPCKILHWRPRKQAIKFWNDTDLDWGPFYSLFKITKYMIFRWLQPLRLSDDQAILCIKYIPKFWGKFYGQPSTLRLWVFSGYFISMKVTNSDVYAGQHTKRHLYRCASACWCRCFVCFACFLNPFVPSVPKLDHLIR